MGLVVRLARAPRANRRPWFAESGGRLRAWRLGVVGLLVAIAQMPAGAQTKAASPAQEPRYDPAAMVDVQGAVTDVREVAAPNPMKGLHLSVKSDSGAFDVYLAPMEYLKDFGVTFAKGDRVQVAGSKVKFQGAEVILAREVRRDQDMIYLRDSQGKPFWLAT